ncbi:hypothetical protein IW261DRAFT_1571478 [Armillaria novae-zelandiae]|uniref:Uncharacterized protein n=1 Tax=Armillaria novae-zelandiae TaxID=153914 RepID=A0AA39NTY4_9AGAR|nr:hypothetical protein IW261DRAFT_1571478 [Armillaria novae-zelandiae]
MFAIVISLINDRLIASGKPVLGFFNPFAFFDITTGSNPGYGTNGFPALAGWDPVRHFRSQSYVPYSLTLFGLGASSTAVDMLTLYYTSTIF